MTSTPVAVPDQTREAVVAGIPVMFWNPERKTNIWGRRALRFRPVDNFGDLLGPVVVKGMIDRFGGTPPQGDAARRRLFAIGSILQFSRPGDVVWGAGVNGKVDPGTYRLEGLDVRAVRGPQSRALLQDRFGLDVPEVYGDPGLLLPYLRPEVTEWAKTKKHDLTVVPNLNDLRSAPRTKDTVSPRDELWSVIKRIVQSRLVVGSSLHGVIVAEAFGIPARAVVSPEESAFKYEDYLLGTGRAPEGAFAPTVERAVAMGGAQPPAWSAQPLLAAFPRDLWKS
ncbi:polysaccharide pyruvyl transferase family protein [Nakamurella sp. YIM 132087]|uniref:Polysaccharide pyruvyl transferase family protein n=1 Tax=Nakamurella alba TaxID=2665158 RepID=A0A7K1FSM4_9ACTN|nr:polysaccharide pyruvyl transferase family protein [Nakamurella alba]MTD15844.1 polysaccharide pyruvyl transferase family protein [Nakamurella alba]